MRVKETKFQEAVKMNRKLTPETKWCVWKWNERVVIMNELWAGWMQLRRVVCLQLLLSLFRLSSHAVSVYTLRLSISAYHRATDKIIVLRRRRSSQHVFVPYLLTDGSLGSCGRFKGHEGRGPLRYQTSVSCVVSARLQSYRFCFIASAKDVMFYPQFVCLSVC